MQENFDDQRDMQSDKQLPTAEEHLANRKSTIRRRAWWALGIGTFIIVIDIFWLVLYSLVGLEFQSYINIFIILGFFFVAAGLWGLYEARRLSIEDITPTSEAREFSQSLSPVTPFFSQLLIGGFIFVLIAQVYSTFETEQAMLAAAALVKPGTLERWEYWRLLTSAVMHGGILHIFFNSYATFVLGNLIETISNRAHLAILFILAAVSGGLFSCFFMPEGLPSVGASGGIMGMIGFLAVYGYKRKRQLPSDFLRTMIINILLIAGIGLFATGFSETVKIDNAAHFGGLIMGLLYGFLLIPRDYKRDPRTASQPITVIGYVAMAVFFATCIFTILLLLEKIIL